jgi:PAS domain S-box-containing protein
MPGSELIDDQIKQIGIIGPNGILKLSTSQSTPAMKLDLSKREQFRFHLDAKNDNLFIGKPVIGQSSGRWQIPISRRIELSDGSFGGVIGAIVDPDYFSRFYDSVALGKHGRIIIVGLDGFVRAVGGDSSEQPGRDLSKTRLFEHYSKQATGWFYAPSALSDKIPRLVSYRTVAEYPFIISIGVSTDEIFAEATLKQRAYKIVGTIFTALVLIVIVWIVFGRLARERILEQLHKQNLRFGAALNYMSQGLSMYDSSQRIIVANRRYCEINGLTEEQVVPGMTLRQIVQYRRINGTYDGPDPAEIISANTTMSEEIQTHNNGNVIRLLRHPMPDGGWLTTFEDITEKRKIEQENDRNRIFLDTILDNVPAPIFVKKASDRR